MLIKRLFWGVIDFINISWKYILIGLLVTIVGMFIHDVFDTVTDTPGGFIEVIGIVIIVIGFYKGLK